MASPPLGLTPTDLEYFKTKSSSKGGAKSIQDFLAEWTIDASSWTVNEWQKLYTFETGSIPGSTTLEGAQAAKASDEIYLNAKEWFYTMPKVIEVRALAQKRVQEERIKKKAQQMADSVVGIDAPPPPPGLSEIDAKVFKKTEDSSIQDYVADYNTYSWGATEWVNLYIYVINDMPVGNDPNDIYNRRTAAHKWYETIPEVVAQKVAQKLGRSTKQQAPPSVMQSAEARAVWESAAVANLLPPPGLTQTDLDYFKQSRQKSMTDFLADLNINTSSWTAKEWQKLYISQTRRIPCSTTLEAAVAAEASDKMLKDTITWFNSIPEIVERRAEEAAIRNAARAPLRQQNTTKSSSNSAGKTRTSTGNAPNNTTAEEAPMKPEEIINSFAQYTRLSPSISQQFFDIFGDHLSNLIRIPRGDPPVSSWGRDDWLAFIDTYFRNRKTASTMAKSIESLKRNLYSLTDSEKVGTDDAGKWGIRSAQMRLDSEMKVNGGRGMNSYWTKGMTNAQNTTKSTTAGVSRTTSRKAQNNTAAEEAPMKPEEIINNFAQNTGLSLAMSQQFFDIFGNKLPELIMRKDRGTPSPTSWGRDDWLAFIDTYFQNRKSTSTMAQTIDSLKKNLSTLKDSDRAGGVSKGWYGREAAQLRLNREDDEAQSRNNGYGTMTVGEASAKMAAAGEKMAAAEMKMAQVSNGMRSPSKPVDIKPVLGALSTINTTLVNSINLIESTAKKNDINPELSEMNDYLLEILSNFPGQGGGGKSTSKKGTPKKKGKSAKDTKAKPQAKSKAPSTEKKTSDVSSATADPNVIQVGQGLNTINTTLTSTLASVANRLKTNSVSSELERTNRYLSEINDMLAEQHSSSGGGIGRLTHKRRMKKGKKTRGNRRA